ncbi:Ubiquinol oxidase [Handroanthus impetiginosus]|uniref:Ubiquinol oxidase n=1 Tax=Handroanthus impetiginosus TaxID=429701 RepID=A0A2G9FVW9_9LAMI|nr:Ubiquinol oxidase [Handroanthus impetiginosus]
MNHLVARAAMKRIIAGGNCYASSAAAGGRVLTPFDASASAAGLQEQGLSTVVIGWRRMMSTVAETAAPSAVVEKDDKSNGVEKLKEQKGDVMVSSYWGISRKKITREDGTEWPWNCFMPWETYQTDLSIDLSKHHVPKTFLDRVAYRTVKLLRIPTDLLFKV